MRKPFDPFDCKSDVEQILDALGLDGERIFHNPMFYGQMWEIECEALNRDNFASQTEADKVKNLLEQAILNKFDLKGWKIIFSCTKETSFKKTLTDEPYYIGGCV